MTLQKSRPKQMDNRGQPAPFECLEDEIPYASLCSLAIYKLYEDWTSDGVDLSTEMYEFRGSGRILAKSGIEASAGNLIGNLSWNCAFTCIH